MFYIKLLFLFLWLVVCSVLGTVYAVLRWGNVNVNRDFARTYSWGALKILGIKLEMRGLENVSDQPAVYIANHQSGLDMITFGQAYPPRAVVIGKREVAFIPIFGIFYLAAGNIIIDRTKTKKAVAGLQQLAEEVKRRGVSLWMFPEGTRNHKTIGLLPFKRGAFHTAIQAQVPLVPMISGPLAPLANWGERRLSSGSLKIRVLPPIPTVGCTAEDAERLCDLARTQMVQAFEEMIQNPKP